MSVLDSDTHGSERAAKGKDGVIRKRAIGVAVLLAAIAFMLILFGSGLNNWVLAANGGKMPIASVASVIGHEPVHTWASDRFALFGQFWSIGDILQVLGSIVWVFSFAQVVAAAVSKLRGRPRWKAKP